MLKNTSQAFTKISPEQRIHDSALTAIRRLIVEIRDNREQILTVYRQNFRNSYHGTVIGVLWNFILPLIPITVYLFLAKIRVFPNFDGVSGATFLTFGVAIWFVLAGFVQLPIHTVASRSDEAMKTALPLSASIVSAFAILVFETIIRFGFVVVILIVTKSWPTPSSPFIFLILVPAFLLFFGVGLILSVLNVVYQDIARVVTIILTYGIFISGVIFPMGNSEIAMLNAKFNPFAVFVNASREIVFQNKIEHYLPFGVWSGIGVIIFIIGARLFYVMEYRIRGLN